MKRLITIQKSLVVPFMCFGCIVYGQDSQPDLVNANIKSISEFQINKIENRINIDGKLDEEVWQQAVKIPLPFETFPGNNTIAEVTTNCLLTYDSEYFYFAFEAEDPDPRKIRGYITDRDDIDQHDRVTLMIDPFKDARRAFEFSVSALGVQSDGIYNQQNNDTDNSWDAIWESAGQIVDGGYVVEAAIPFKSLRFPSSDQVQTWGFFALRQYPRSDNIELRSTRLDRNNSCLLCQVNLLKGLEGIKPGVNLQVTPTFTASKTDENEDFPEGSLSGGSIKAEAGVDIRWNITSDLTLNTTVNPDFSQVEANVAQLNINNRFALFFPERRPFFMEGADFYSTPLRAVFTRTIADPSFGTKLTGKLGKSAMGLIVARDQVNNLIFPSNQGSSTETIEQDVNVLLGRFRRDIGKSSNIGVLITDREANGYHNRVGGIDGFWRLSKSITAQAQYLASDTKYNDTIATNLDQKSNSFSGSAVRTFLQFENRKWFSRLQWQRFDEDFRADAGFMTQVDFRSFNGWVQRRIWGENKSWFTRIVLSSGFWKDQNIEGRLTESGLWFHMSYQGPLQSNLSINPNFRREYFEGEIYDLQNLWSRIRFQPSGNLSFQVLSFFGTTIDFENNRKADQLNISPDLTVRIGRKIDIRLSHTYRKLSKREFKIFEVNLSQIRAVYNFNTRTFIRAIIQYNQTSRNTDAYLEQIDQNSKSLFTQLLLSYKLNPQSVFFIGYSDNSQGMLEDNQQKVPLTLVNRTLFLKIGYAWRP